MTAPQQATSARSHVIWVAFRVRPEARAEFLRLVCANAWASLRAEPGCSRFDVLPSLAESDLVCLYEIYDDLAAFQAHLATPHFKDFDCATAGMYTNKQVQSFELLHPEQPR
jgi:autoinducer 2-degrading protein